MTAIIANTNMRGNPLFAQAVIRAGVNMTANVPKVLMNPIEIMRT